MHDTEARLPLERLPIPHQFKPQLTVFDAMLAVFSALTQILLGCLIAALWGVRIWLAAVSGHSTFWKTFVIFALSAGMLASVGILIYAVQAGVGRLSKNRR